MSKSRKPKKRKHGGSAPVVEQADAAIESLDRIARTLDGLAPAAAGPVWGEAQHALMKTKADRKQVMQVIMSRDLAALQRMADELAGRSSEATPSAAPDPESESPPPPAREFEHELLKRAMRAFRKRLKLARLDDESKLGVGPMTGGKHSRIHSILPPHEFEREIWEELARQGQLRDIGQGFFELAEEPPVRD